MDETENKNDPEQFRRDRPWQREVLFSLLFKPGKKAQSKSCIIASQPI